MAALDVHLRSEAAAGALHAGHARGVLRLRNKIVGSVGVRLVGLAALPLRPWLRRVTERLVVERHDVALPRVTEPLDGLVVGFVSDLHAGRVTTLQDLEPAIDAVAAENPDLVLLGGDYVDNSASYAGAVAALLSRLRAPLGTYGVLGNHDHDSGAAVVRDALERNGVRVLHNEGLHVRDGLYVAGVDDLRLGRPDLAAALAGRRAGDLTLVLSHNPDLSVHADPSVVDLMLSGHTHGGQILPLGRAVITHSRYGTKLLSGLRSHAGGCLVYVSRGVGSVALPLRHGSPPEVALLRLTRG